MTSRDIGVRAAPLVAAVAGAAFAVGQLLLAELTGVSELGAEFAAGNERVEGVQVTLVAWLCAISVPLAVAVAGHRHQVAARMVSACAAAFGALAVLPIASSRSSAVIYDDVRSAVVLGVLLGFVTGLVVAAVPVTSWGIAAHSALWWLLAAPAALVWTRVVGYAGLVEMLELDSVRSVLRPVLPTGRVWSYHLPYMLPSVLLTVVLSGVLAAFVARRTGSLPQSIGAAVAAPLLAVAAYSLGDGGQLSLWNGEALVIAMVTAVAAAFVSVVAALALRRPATAAR